VKLKSTNLPQFQEVIPLECLPQTFSDAIRITALLGCKYLWIDSLCIIHDSEEEWNQQSGLMGTIYRSAVQRQGQMTVVVVPFPMNQQYRTTSMAQKPPFHTLLYGLWLHRLPLELLWSALKPANERLDIEVPTGSCLAYYRDRKTIQIVQ
jgi:hypothetical protein